MKRVKRSYCEVPFVVTVSGVRITGSIDRLCELSDGTWVVIDYKSDPVTPAEYSLKAEEYAVSMGVYCEAARQIVGAEVAGWLYFTETGEFLGVQIKILNLNF
jgi:ATP-dependent exoDNAse (exonuclease V) beta subunit